MQRKTNYFAVGLIVASFLLSLSLGADSASAASATITTNTDITLNASSAGNGVTIDEESIGITTTCNKGYNLTIATSTSTDLYLNGDSTKTAAFAAVDGTSALDSTNNTNKWGYTLTNNATSSTVFSPLSTTASSIRTISQTTDITSETIPIYYGIKTDNSVDPGTYAMGNNGTITYYLTMNPLCNVVDIAYDGNNADAGTMGAAGTGVIHTGVKDGDTVDLIASNFSRDGYGFAGWSLDQDAGTKLLDNDNTNNPVVYGPQESVTLPEGFTANDTDNDGIVKLYAVWLQSQGNLQGWMGCANLDTATYDSTTGALDLTKNSVTALTDQRDNDTYAVARLADGECWMIENLRLDNTNSDNSTGALAQGYATSNIYGNFVGLANPESTTFGFGSKIANSIYYIDNPSATSTIDINTVDYAYAPSRMPRYNNLNTTSRAIDPTGNVFAEDNTTGGLYSYGNYYTWHAAIANTIAYSSRTFTDADGKTSDTVNTSICPDGWRLPYGTSVGNGAAAGGFSYLDTALGGDGKGSTSASAAMLAKWRAYPNDFVYSGSFEDKAAVDRGSYGYYWSSTASNQSNSAAVDIGGSLLSPGTYSAAADKGFSVRCIASKPWNHTLTYDANGGSGAPASPEAIYTNATATFTISGASPSRSGYTFTGWTDKKGNEFQPNGTITTGETDTTLYAIWANNSCNPTATTIGTGNAVTDAVCLQDVTPSMRASLPTADATTGTYTLIDARDNQSYTIAKLADGNLWMTKNLNYSSTDLNTSHDTDIISSSTIRLPQSTTTSNTNNTAITIRTTNNSGNNNNGTYYSWPAAIASSIAYTTGNVTTSICPKGWDLPMSDFYTNLKTQADYKTGNLTTSAPSSFLINGGFTNGSSFYTTSYSHFWTSTVNNATTAYGAIVNGTTMTTSASTGSTYGGDKYFRKNIRCVASSGIITINYESNGNAEYPVTGTVESQTNVEVNLTSTQANGFTRTGWAFNGWNTAADGTGTAIAASTAISTLSPTPGSTITLYAQWVPQYTITYVNNCRTWANSDTNCTSIKSSAKSEQKISLINNPSIGAETDTLAAYDKWTLTGWKIKEWTTSADGTGTAYPVASTYTVPAGSSVGSSITLYAHWVPIYTVQYDGNGSDNDSTGMGSTNTTTGIKTVNHTNVAEGDTFDLFASNFKRAGYGFVGWSTDSDAWNKLTDNDTTNDAKIWGPNEIITAPAYNGTPITTLYAIWAPAEKTDPSNPSSTPVYLQGWTGCSAMTATTYDTTGTLTVAKNSITALTDQRDGNVYTIAKLADENCWMVENLRLADAHEESGSTVATTLTTANTNILASNSTLPITNIYNADSSLATTSNSLSPSSSQNSTNDPSYGWCTNQNAACYDQSRFNTTNTVANITPSQTQNITSANAHTNFYNTIYAYGNYYNWYSATAGYGTYSRSTSTPTDGDLCPAGWHLPYGYTSTGDKGGNTSGGFYYLASRMTATGSNTVNSNKFRTFPNNFIYAGFWYGGSANYRGEYGSYWSASASSSNGAYHLNLDSTGVSPGDSSGIKYLGLPVRCTASPAS